MLVHETSPLHTKDDYILTSYNIIRFKGGTP